MLHAHIVMAFGQKKRAPEGALVISNNYLNIGERGTGITALEFTDGEYSD